MISPSKQGFLVSDRATIAIMPKPLICECGSCNVCLSRERMRLARAADPERFRARDRRRYREQTTARRALADAYRQTPEGKAAAERARAGWRSRNPERRAAQVAVGNALRDGRLVRGACVREGDDCTGRVEAHHEDYARPLDVVWACVRHHDELDRERST